MAGSQGHKMQLPVDHYGSELAGSQTICVSSQFWPHTAPEKDMYVWDGWANKHLASESSDENQDFEEVVVGQNPSYWYRQSTGPDNT